jgi:hypothetical protein
LPLKVRVFQRFVDELDNVVLPFEILLPLYRQRRGQIPADTNQRPVSSPGERMSLPGYTRMYKMWFKQKLK